MSRVDRSWMVWARCRPAGWSWLKLPVEDQLSCCARCPVIEQCIDYALAVRATNVVMGGIVIGTKPLRRREGLPWAPRS